jgi:hypothetical protein
LARAIASSRHLARRAGLDRRRHRRFRPLRPLDTRPSRLTVPQVIDENFRVAILGPAQSRRASRQTIIVPCCPDVDSCWIETCLDKQIAHSFGAFAGERLSGVTIAAVVGAADNGHL